MKRNRRFFVVLITGVMVFSYSNSAYGASKSQTVIDAINSYLSKVELDYQKDLQAASNQYSPQISTTQLKISEAKSRFLSANQVRVLKQGESRNYWGNFDCPSARPSCIYVDKGPLFQIGEVTTIKSLMADKSEYLDEMDIIINLGLIELLNQNTFQEASKTIRIESINLNNLNKSYQSSQNSIKLKKEKGMLVESALLAAERASRNPSSFDKSFVTALKFEYNRVRLSELASMPWKYINSYKELTSAINVTRISDRADTIASNYSLSQAAGINSVCGKTFINESDYQEFFKNVAMIYKQTTKVTLKL